MLEPQITLTFDPAYWQRITEIITTVVRNELTAQKEEDLSQKRYSIAEIMELFQVTRSTVLNWRKKNLLTGERIGRKVYFSQNEIQAALKTIKKYHLKIA